jgi:acyl dehydratase
VRTIVTEVKPSRSRPDRGIVRLKHEVSNQTGEVVMVVDNPVLFGRRT